MPDRPQQKTKDGNYEVKYATTAQQDELNIIPTEFKPKFNLRK